VITGHRWFYQAGPVEVAAALQAEARVARMNEASRRRQLSCEARRGRAQMPRNGVAYQRSKSLFIHVCL
jgi:hypothetical protein